MIKRWLCLLLCGLLVLIGSVCNAGTGVQHEDDLELALLGRKLSEKDKNPDLSTDQKAVLFGYLEDAIYLCIDQAGSDGQKWLDELNNKFQVPGLPKSVSEFSVPKSDDHQHYTHMGWDYGLYQYPEKWEIRKNILLATVSKVFGFHVDENQTGNDRYTEQCKDMAKLIYYIHILGDHSRDKFATTNARIQLRNDSKTRGEIEKGLINELRTCLSHLLYDKRTSFKYCRMMVKLNVIRFRAWKTGEEDSEEKHKKIKDIAEDALNYLNPGLSELLMETSFFRNVFSGI